MNQDTLPVGALNVRLNPKEWSRLRRLQRLLGDATQRQAVAEAITHYLETLERGERVYRFVSSEQTDSPAK